jgi:hypothetical protein
VLWYSGLWHRVILYVVTDVSEERIIFSRAGKMEVIRYSETSITIYKITRYHNPEYHTFCSVLSF